MTTPRPESGWFPIAHGDDLVERHVFHGQLLGRELAVWRADDGHVNVWENRCLHRGVRLSIGLNEGQELKCQYHGWRYANRTAGCTYIPAHPADSPARTICNVWFPAVELGGLVWTQPVPGPAVGTPTLPTGLAGGRPFGLRHLPVNASPEHVLEELAAYRFAPTALLSPAVADGHDKVEVTVSDRSDSWIELTARVGDRHDTVAFFVQPVDERRAVIRGLLAAPPAAVDRLTVLRYHHQMLSHLRDGMEQRSAHRPQTAPTIPALQRVALRTSPPGEAAPTTPGIRVTVAERTMTAAGICAISLEPVDGQLPTSQPGAHIDVQLPNGLTRQYSLVNGPGELDRYVIGVKRQPDSRGGSAALHDTVRIGDVLAISAPHNNFPLRRDSFRTILIAGGIGVTPLLSMAQALQAGGLRFELHYFAQAADHLAFPDRLAHLGDSVVSHLGLSPDETAVALTKLLAVPSEGEHVYVCGPGPMLDLTRRLAATAGWADDTVHFEYFQNTATRDASASFDIELARSALTLHVAAGQSILDVLRDNGVGVPSSCEQGACGTCVTTVLAGEPDHQDVYLNASERAAGDRMMICVSRARTGRLVLDI